MKVALLADTHFGEKGDAAVMLDYQERFFNEVFFPYLDKHKEIRHVIHLGDVVDRRKYINVVTAHRARQMFFEPLRKRNLKLDVLVGNHDCYFKNTNKVNAIREFWRDYDNITLFEGPLIADVGGFKVAYVPWINEENLDETMEFIEHCEASLCFGHLELKGFLNNDGLPSYSGSDPRTFQRFDQVYTGHFHNKISNGNVTYLGTPYQMRWDDYGHSKGFHVLNLTSRKLEFVENPLTLFNKLFYNDQDSNIEHVIKTFEKYRDTGALTNTFVKVIVEQKNDPYLYDQFRETLESLEPFDIKYDEVNMEKAIAPLLQEQTHVDDTLTIINNTVQNLDVSVSKKKLAKLLTDVYRRASSVQL